MLLGVPLRRPAALGAGSVYTERSPGTEMKRCICAPRPLLLGRDCKHRAADDKGLVLHSSPRFPWQNSQPPARSSCERVLASTRLEERRHAFGRAARRGSSGSRAPQRGMRPSL